MTNALAIDTTSDFLSLALLKGGRPVASHYAQCGVKATQLVFREIDTLLAGAELEPDALDLLLVAIGPGSFTGTRIGMAVAQTFAQVLERPILGVDTLSLLAAQTEPPAHPAPNARFHALLHCTRDEVYHAPFAWREGLPERIGEVGLTAFERLEGIVESDPVTLRRFDPEAAAGADVMRRLRQLPLRHPFPDGMLLLELGLAAFHAMPGGPFPAPRPIYLKSEAFRKWRP